MLVNVSLPRSVSTGLSEERLSILALAEASHSRTSRISTPEGRSDLAKLANTAARVSSSTMSLSTPRQRMAS